MGMLDCGVRFKGRLRNFFLANAAIDTDLPSGRSRNMSICDPNDDERSTRALPLLGEAWLVSEGVVWVVAIRVGVGVTMGLDATGGGVRALAMALGVFEVVDAVYGCACAGEADRDNGRAFGVVVMVLMVVVVVVEVESWVDIDDVDSGGGDGGSGGCMGGFRPIEGEDCGVDCGVDCSLCP